LRALIRVSSRVGVPLVILMSIDFTSTPSYLVAVGHSSPSPVPRPPLRLVGSELIVEDVIRLTYVPT